MCAMIVLRMPTRNFNFTERSKKLKECVVVTSSPPNATAVAANHGNMSRTCEGNGQCLAQRSVGCMAYVGVVSDCPHGCRPMPCAVCGLLFPQWLAQLKESSTGQCQCMACDIREYCGSPPRLGCEGRGCDDCEEKEREERRARGACLECGRALVPIGRARRGGKVTHDDWEGREYHKACWTRLHRAGEVSCGRAGCKWCE